MVGRGRRKEREGRERKSEGSGLNEFFFKSLEGNIEICQHKIFREFEALQLLFWIKAHLRFNLEVILYLRLLEFEFLFISCV
jgi:hypothetical protein